MNAQTANNLVTVPSFVVTIIFVVIKEPHVVMVKVMLKVLVTAVKAIVFVAQAQLQLLTVFQVLIMILLTM